MSSKNNKETGKNRIYTGQLVTSETYNSFTKDQRNFWNKAHKAFLKGNMYFKHNGMLNIVPFRLSDGSFDTVLEAEKFNNIIEESKKIKEEKNNEQVIRSTDGGQSEPIDRLVTSIE